MTRGRAAAAGLALLAAFGLPLALLAPARADDQPASGVSIDHAQPVQGGVRLLVSVPDTGTPDLGGVQVRVAGDVVPSTATPAASSEAVRRTAVLAIDTSASMRGRRITAARDAALAYLATVPANVAVGVVTFDDGVHRLLAPTRDRARARAVVSDLRLTRDTALYDGVLGAVRAAGPGGTRGGQRSVLVLSDGKDTTSTSLVDTAKAVQQSGVSLEVVSLEQGDEANPALAILARAGRGRVIDAQDPAALTRAFSAEARTLARQLVVTAQLPRGKAMSADVTVSVPVDGRESRTQAYVPIRSEATQPRPVARGPVEVPADAGQTVSSTVVVGGVAAMGVGIVGVFLALAFARPKMTKEAEVAERMKAYGIVTTAPDGSGSRSDAGAATNLADQARHAAERALAGNKSLETAIASRLEGAGLSLKPAEWLLTHATVSLLAGIVGLGLSGGSILGALLFVVLGGVGGWAFLVVKRTRRLRAFASGLADTLQLMSSSLSAGLSLAQSLDTIVREGNEPIAGEFRRVLVESRLGVPLEESLAGVAQRMESRDFEWVVMAITIQRDVGGNLAELLLTVAATLREREFLRRHVKALSAEGRLSAWVLGGLPPVFLLYLVVSKGDYVRPLYTTPLGLVMCGAMVVMLAVGVFWMSKVAKVEV